MAKPKRKVVPIRLGLKTAKVEPKGSIPSTLVPDDLVKRKFAKSYMDLNKSLARDRRKKRKAAEHLKQVVAIRLDESRTDG